jgi:DNA repair protein RecN (Recombination protein N)
MLTALHIQDFVLIDQLSLAVGDGMTALTGETGAGKSILLEALGLAAGARQSRATVRQGARQGVVTAAFEPTVASPVWRLLEDNGIAATEGDVILRRVQSVDGKSRAFINDQPVSIALLRDIGAALIEIHGQHDGVSFLSAATHRDLLDAFAAADGDAKDVAARWRLLADARADLEARRRERDQAAREADYLRHVVRELEALAPAEDEENKLVETRARLIGGQKRAEDVAAAAAAVSPERVENALAEAARRLARASATDDARFAAAIEKVERALSEAMEARAAIDDLAEREGADEGSLDAVEERLFALRAAARKHGVTPDGLTPFLAKAQAALTTVDAGEAAFAKLEKEIAAAKKNFDQAARALSDKRRTAAAALDKAVAGELAPLKLAKATFQTRVVTDPDAPGAHGFDQVEFMVATNPGAPMGPLKTIASGGELSRFVLAMKAALAARESRTVIIFDEVDAGVGGAVADAVGERLARLARDAQVLVVTHSPQVAARASSHWRVEKSQSKGETTTQVKSLSDAERIEEIARMLSGAVVTDEARAAARSLLGAPPKERRKKSA